MIAGRGLIDEEALNIFTDGSSFPHKKRAAGVGVRFVWVNESGDVETEDYAPAGYQSATIDEMEIQACIEAMNEANRVFTEIERFKKILIFSDSNYVVDNYFNAMYVWPKKKWLKKNGMPVANINLWKKLKKQINKCSIPVKIEWVKSHKSNLHNRAADKLAKESASKPINKPLSLSETTSKWSSRKTKRGCISILGQETKIRIVSRKYITKAKTNEYRYEVIDPEDKFFKDLDFAYCDITLSRNNCYQVRFNDDQTKPFIVKLISELDCAEYKY